MMDEEKNESLGMSPESLSRFSATLAGLGIQEIQKAKELYIRNAITTLQSEIKQRKNNWWMMAIHLLIPIFWPMLFGAQRKGQIMLDEQKAKIENALEVWRDDLGSSYNTLKQLLADTVMK